MIIDEIINTMCNVYGALCPDEDEEEEEEEGRGSDEFVDSGM